jgi:hypothetical protein
MITKIDIKITDDEVQAINPFKDTCSFRTINDSTITLDRKTLDRMIACMDSDKKVKSRLKNFPTGRPGQIQDD